jgi:hypothetical protein
MDEVKAPPLSPSNVQLAEFVRTTHVAEIPHGVALSNVLRPEYWAHCAKKFKPYSVVECRAQDNKWMADLVIASVGEFGVNMWVKTYVDIAAQGKKPEVSEPVAGSHTVSFAPRQRWRGIRDAVGAVLHKEEAQAWLDQYLKTPA